jgi:imidazolonepropionase-like amidohydrolase
LLVGTLALAGCQDTTAGVGVTALVGGAVVDVVAGRVIPDAVVLIRDGSIVSVGSATDVAVPRGATRVELPGRWIVPGFIDAHAHLQPWGLDASLRYGVTTVRDLHDGLPLADTLRARVGKGPTPRLFLAGAMVDAPPTTYPDAISIAESDSADAVVGALAASGVQWIKGYTHLTPTLLQSLVAAARNDRLPVAVHLGLTNAVEAAMLGVSSIEHLSGIPEAADDSLALRAAHRRGFFAGWTAFENAWSTMPPAALGAVARDLAATGVILVPTLGLHETFSRLDDSTVYRSPDLAAVPDSARENWNVAGMIRRAGWEPEDFRRFRDARATQDAFVRTFVAAGGRIATGTDASNQLLVPGAGVHLEMELLVHAGLTPLDALRAATLNGAQLLRAEHLGRIRPGAAADLVVLGGNPLAEIRNTRQIVRVMSRGEWVER